MANSNQNTEMGRMLKDIATSKGASYISVTLGPKATVEGIKNYFEQSSKREKVYNSYSKESKLLAQLDRYKNYRRKVLDMCSASELSKSKIRELFNMSDIWPDVSLETDIKWMQENCSLNEV